MRYKRYLDINVLEAARVRVAEAVDMHDTPVVFFSGGKDSLVVLHLVLDEVKRRGGKALDVVFYDEELIPDCVINFVKTYYDRDDIRMTWYALPMLAHKFVLGDSATYIQWDPTREWVRPKPEWSTTLGDGREVYQQATCSTLVAQNYPGSVVFFTGTRAAESFLRYSGIMQARNDPGVGINQRCRTTSRSYPIYDWTEDDVFKFFYDHDIEYASIYDWQIMAGLPRRVATPIAGAGAKLLEKWRTMDPGFYDRVTQMFPETILNRYRSEVDKDSDIEKYGRSFVGVRRWIVEHMEGKVRTAALEAMRKCMIKMVNRPQSYHPVQMLKWAKGGATHKMAMVLNREAYDKLKEKYW